MSFRVLYKDFLSKEVISYKGNVLKNIAYVIEKNGKIEQYASSKEILEDYPDFILSNVPDLTQGVESWSKSNNDDIPELDMREVEKATKLFLIDPLNFFDTLMLDCSLKVLN